MAGSNKRQRGKIIASRCLDDEFAAIAAKADKADKAGLSAGAFLRAAGLGSPGPRAKRRPPADHKALRKYMGDIGRMGNNLNQIARAMNAGNLAIPPELEDTIRDCRKVLNDIRQALGKNEGPEP